MNGRTQNDILTEIQALKKKMAVQSTELETFLMYLDQSVFKRGFLFCGPAKVSESPEFMRAFNSLNSMQKCEYYLNCLQVVQELIKKQNSNVSTNEQKMKYQISFRLNGLKEWIPTTMTLDKLNSTIFLQSSEKTIDLHHYILRHSKSKERNAFVLQSFIPKNIIQTVRITHSNFKIFQQLQNSVKNSMRQSLKERLMGKLNIGKKKSQVGKKQLVKRESISAQIAKGKQRKSLRELVEQSNTNINFTIDDFNAIASTLINHNIIDSLDNYSEYEELTEGVFINLKKDRVRKVYYFNQEDFTKDWIIEQLNKYQKFKIWKNSLFMISLLASIPAEKTQIFHQINTYKDRTQCDYVYLRHFFREGDKSYFIDKSISTLEYGSHETNKSRGNIEYCIWRIGSQKNRIQVLVQCQISHVQCGDIYDLIEQHIGEVEKIGLSKITSQKGKIKTTFDDIVGFEEVEMSKMSSGGYKEFTSYEGLTNHQRGYSEFYTIYSKQEGGLEDEKGLELEWQSTTQRLSASNYRYQISPQTNCIKQYKFMKNGLFFDDSECVVNGSGDLLFVNQQKIKAQSSVMKKVVKKIGSNIFSGKSVLNISLPIQIFASDTNLQRLCKGNAYAPIFLENKQQASPLQKMKAVISYSLGNILLYIEMAKPFNPILGETYQGFINGCPIYGEQISHHPPISSFFMVGRGFFTHANLEAKVNFGLNNASGINEGYYKVAFDSVDPNKNVIAFVSPPGQLSGLVLGQRKLALTSKTQYFDENNQIFCEITWGKNKKQKQTSYSDYLQGKIVKLSKYQTEMKKIKVSKQDQVLGVISGRWTQKICFQDQVIFDINQTRPYRVVQQLHPLQSDGRFRKDKMLVSLNQFEEGQKAKEQLEQLQRKDRKLRKQK